MGVHDLWPILSELCERKPLTYLSGKKVAVDLSGWVVQATQCKGLNIVKNPHLRNLFFRVSCLLKHDVYPIFVMEGKPPSLKEAAFKERNFNKSSATGSVNYVSRQIFDRILDQCQDLLNCLGVPCVKSSGEAEAFCAFLFLNGIVDGVITEDNDAFLYGADVVYRDFTIEENDSHVNVYCLKSEKNKMQLDRKKLVALALLLGCDYAKGVPGVGKETAIKMLSELNDKDILQRFKEWKDLSESELFPGLGSNPVKKSSHCNRCGHLGSLSKHKKDGCSVCNSEITCYLPDESKPCTCAWHVSEETKKKRKNEIKVYSSAKKDPDFPNQKVIDEYLNFNDTIPYDEILDWNCPDLMKFREKALNYLGWTFESSFEKVLPLITAWQQFKIKNGSDNKADFIYEPVEILKERSRRDLDFVEVQWKVIGNNSDFNVPTEDLITWEDRDRFSACYKEIADRYFDMQSQLKEKKNSKKKKADIDESNRKIDEFFVCKSRFKNGGSSKENANAKTVDATEDTMESHSHTDEPSPKRLCT